SGDPPPSVGNFVVVDHHDGTYGTYWHLLAGSVPVAVGDAVVTGQVLGRVGNTGNSSAPHLHFDVRVDWELDYPMPKFKEYRSIRVRMRDKNHACWIPRKTDTLASDNTVTLPPMTAKSRRVPATGSRAPQPSPRTVPRPKQKSRGDAQPSRERSVERATPPG